MQANQRSNKAQHRSAAFGLWLAPNPVTYAAVSGLWKRLRATITTPRSYGLVLLMAYLLDAAGA
ncbi:unnamed protein product [Ceratitis capitata]|uniref:(Mediterranean fruit fly) hypothetical protein n=1 Tax=Ceratitis capitata TaxID=7213 RepID=A0A811U0W4_CERCA|nr:unnamed protein product [Ceratitis capitata]